MCRSTCVAFMCEGSGVYPKNCRLAFQHRISCHSGYWNTEPTKSQLQCYPLSCNTFLVQQCPVLPTYSVHPWIHRTPQCHISKRFQIVRMDTKYPGIPRTVPGIPTRHAVPLILDTKYPGIPRIVLGTPTMQAWSSMDP